MKTLAIVGMLLMSSLCLAQSVAGDTQFASILPNEQGKVLQYAFPVSPFYPTWNPAGHVKKFTFAGTNEIELQTVAGKTVLYFMDTHDICGPKAGPVGSCAYMGTMSEALTVTPMELPDGATYSHVTGIFYGPFYDNQGNLFSNALCLLSFDTYPSVDQVKVPSAGSVVIVLQNN